MSSVDKKKLIKNIENEITSRTARLNFCESEVKFNVYW